MKIGSYQIGLEEPPFIIAEMSGNHNQSLSKALEIVDAAAAAGAHAIKLQTYTADSITLNVTSEAFQIRDQSSIWAGKNLYELYQMAYTPWEWHAPIMERAAQKGLVCFSSPFNEAAVDFLESLKVPAYKIASFENSHLPLIRKVASTGKPIIISTGMASLAELDEAVKTARNAGCKDLVLLKCTSTYPASPEYTNICTIPHLKELFNCEVGLSDHTMGIGVSIAATALGATVIEKHFTIARADGGVDSSFSMEPSELNDLVIETKRAWQSLGKVTYGATDAEQKSLMFRRSLFIAQDVEAGEILTPENLRVIRPGNGLHPRYYEEMLGKVVRESYKKGTPLTFSMVI